MIKLIKNFSEKIDKLEFGNKADWLNWLNKNGFKVPPCVFLSKNINLDDELVVKNILKNTQKFSRKGKFSVAIRSSSSTEDSEEESKAGHFLSILGEFDENELLNNCKKVQNSGKQKIGVIIQKKIEANFSGVAFSSSPLTGNKLIGQISYVRGYGQKLMAGDVRGTEIKLNYTKNGIEFNKTGELDAEIIELGKIIKSIEKKINFPVDVEWVSDNREIYIIQTRPITGLFFKTNKLIEVSLQNRSIIPKIIISNDKIKIRLIAQEFGVNISKAHIFISNNLSRIPKIPNKIDISPSKYCMGYSTVLIHPSSINGKVQRLFANNQIEDKNFISFCYRYGIRALDNKKSVNASLFKLMKLVQNYTWISIAIIQEFWDADFSGIIKKINNCYLIEIAKGHFLAKGIINTSSYFLDLDFNIINKKEIYQEKALNISSGKLEKMIFNKKELISFSKEQLIKIVNEFKNKLVPKFVYTGITP